MDNAERQHLETLRSVHERRLRVLERQAAEEGRQTRPGIVTEIEDIRDKIAEIDRQLTVPTNVTTLYRDTDAALPNYKAALLLSQVSGDRLCEAETLWSIGDAECLRRNYDEALSNYNASLKLHSEIGMESSAALLGIGEVWRLRGDYDRAIASYSNPTGAVKWEGIFLGDTQRVPGPQTPAFGLRII